MNDSSVSELVRHRRPLTFPPETGGKVTWIKEER